MSRMHCHYERVLHAARTQEGLPLELAATIAIVAMRYGPHGRRRAPSHVVGYPWDFSEWLTTGWPGISGHSTGIRRS